MNKKTRKKQKPKNQKKSRSLPPPDRIMVRLQAFAPRKWNEKKANNYRHGF